MPQTHELLIMCALFGLFLMIWLVGVVLFQMRQGRRQKLLRQRLGHAQGAQTGRVLRLWHDDVADEVDVPDLPRKKTLRQRLEQARLDAGMNVPLATIVLGLSGTAMGVFVIIFAIVGQLLPALCGPAAVVLVFWVYLTRRIANRSASFDRQLMDAMELASRSLRGGFPLIDAFKLIAEEVSAPLGTVFAQICQQESMGESLEQGLRKAGAQNNSRDLKLFVTSVLIQLKSGGNLAEMMDRLAEVIRDRIRLDRRVKVLTAQTQFSKRVLAALPIIMFALLNILNPQYVQPLYSTPMGRTLLAVTAVMVTIGVWMMNRMAKIQS